MPESTLPNPNQLPQELEYLRQRVAQLESDNQDLTIALETTTQHGDTIEQQLYEINQQLAAQVSERKLAQATLESILAMVTEDKHDLEIVIETMAEHGDTVEYQLYSDAVDFMRRSEEQFRAIAEATPIVMMIGHLSDGLITYANSTCTEALGIAPSAIQGRKLQEFYFNPQDQVHIAQVLAEDGCVKNYEMQIRRHDQSVIWVAASLHPLVLSGVSNYLSTFYDVTTRKQAQLDLQTSELRLREQAEALETLVLQRTQALQTAETELRTLFEAMTDTILVYDRQGMCVKVAPTKAKQVKFSTDRVNKSIYEIFAPYVADLHLQVIQQALIQQQSLTIEYQRKLLEPQSQQEDLWFLATASPLSENQVIWVERDISDRQKAEADLKSAKEVAEIANSAKSHFLASMSHELRTPLNAILGFSQLMIDDETLSPIQQENLKIIESSGEHLLALINDVLEMSKIESGKLILNEFNIDFYALLDRLKNMLTLKAESKGLSLNFIQVNKIPHYVQGDEVKISQILINLLSNALKFTQAGGVTLSIENLSNSSSPSVRLLFKIEDTGIGISEGEIPMIFDAFVQSQSGRRSQEGTGLGLSISRKFVQLMGGDITAQSVLGKGSIFSFDIELKVANINFLSDVLIEPMESFDQIIDINPLRNYQLDQGNTSLKILLAEDNLVNQKVALRMLNKLGFTADVVADGEQVLSALDQRAYDLILMDIQMPNLDGIETTKLIGERFTSSDRPVIIALTAHAMQEERERCLEAGMQDHLSKPVRLEELKRILEHYAGLVRK